MTYEATLFLGWIMHGQLPCNNLYELDASIMLTLLTIQDDVDDILEKMKVNRLG